MSARTPSDLSLREAAELYDVSLRTLARKARWGEIEAYKVRGPWGHEWRVSPAALEAAGMRTRTARPVTSSGCPQVAGLEREVESLRRTVAAERWRAEQADRELGHAMLESGRLRGALARARAAMRNSPDDAEDDSDPVVMWRPSPRPHPGVEDDPASG